jgi:hypothetical protein
MRINGTWRTAVLFRRNSCFWVLRVLASRSYDTRMLTGTSHCFADRCRRNGSLSSWPRAEVVADDFDRSAGLIAPEHLSIDRQPQGASFIGEHWLFYEQLNVPVEGKNIGGFQENSAAADINRFSFLTHS